MLDFAPIDRLLSRAAGFAAADRLKAETAAEMIGPVKVEAWRPPRLVSERKVRRWREIGLDPWEADRVAVALGWLPQLLWPDYHAALDTAIERRKVRA